MTFAVFVGRLTHYWNTMLIIICMPLFPTSIDPIIWFWNVGIQILFTFIIAVVSVYYVQKQIKENRELVLAQINFSKEQYDKQQLAEQRYEVYVILDKLSINYNAASVNNSVTPILHYTAVLALEDEVKRLLFRPTIMSDEEVEMIYRVTSPTSLSSDPGVMFEEVNKVIRHLESHLRPRLFTILTRVVRENFRNNPL